MLDARLSQNGQKIHGLAPSRPRDRDHITPTLRHSNLFAARRRFVPNRRRSPPSGKRDAMYSRSRDALFVRTQVMRHAIPKNDAASPTFVGCPGVDRPDHHDRTQRTVARIEQSEIRERSRGFHRRSRVSLRSTRATNSFRLASGNQRKQNADRRGSPCFTLRRSAHPAQGALACRRSTAVLPRGLTHPLVRLRTRLRGASTTMAGISRRRRPRLQRAPRTPVIVPAGMMSDTARARKRRNSRSRAPRSRSRQPSSPAGVLLRRARGRCF